MTDEPRYTIVLRAMPADTPPVIRLRAALKCLARAFRLQAIEAREIPGDDRPEKSH